MGSQRRGSPPVAGGQAQAPVKIDAREFRIDPRKVRFVRDKGVATAFISVMRAAKNAARPPARGVASFNRSRCIVKVRYTRNLPQTPWLRHGCYIIRRDATSGRPGFDADGERRDIPRTLRNWQEANDPRMYRIIVSLPEGDKSNLHDITRAMMRQVERDTARRLEWVAAEHANTENRHVHIALRGVDKSGDAYRFDPNYVRYRFRTVAQSLHMRQTIPPLTLQQPQRRRYGLIELRSR